MAPLKVEQYVVGPVQTNCYFAVNDETKEMILIDPGANADRLIQIIEEDKLNPVAIELTFCLSGCPFFRGYAVRPVGRKDGFPEGKRFGADSRHQGEVAAASG